VVPLQGLFLYVHYFRTCSVSLKKHAIILAQNVTSLLVTSMFIERVEILEYRQKFEGELSTLTDSTNTETPRKLVFSLTCVCVCLSVRKVC